MPITFEDAFDDAVQLFFCPGPMTDTIPEEFAEDWVRSATAGDLSDLVNFAKLSSTYEVAQDGYQWSLTHLETFIDAWGRVDAANCFTLMRPLLFEEYGRSAAVMAMHAAAGSSEEFSEPGSVP